ncbi:hypothetical protein AQ914_04590 [Burkholderia pseudomallei]|nr:hypothetical protein AQ914_04590 [Burkholderia pseudomallei]
MPDGVASWVAAASDVHVVATVSACAADAITASAIPATARHVLTFNDEALCFAAAVSGAATHAWAASLQTVRYVLFIKIPDRYI